MMKKAAIGIGALLLVVGLGLTALVRSAFTGDNVRTAVAGQLSEAVGQPVTIGGIGASVYPRITMDLTEVAIGRPARIRLQSVHVGTDLRALFSRRIERAAVRITGARLELPLPDLGAGGRERADEGGPSASAAPPVEIVSIDEIVFRDVELVSGGRTLRGEAELVPRAGEVLLRRVSLLIDDTAIEMIGALTSLSPLHGRVDATADEVDFDRMLSFMNDFAATAAPAPAAESPAAAPPAASGTGAGGMLTFNLSLRRATTGGLALSDVRATALVTAGAVTLDPIVFDVFDGRYDGSMTVSMDELPRFTWRATVAGVDAAALMVFAGSPDTISGTLAGTIALEGRGLEMERGMRTARGTARVDITDGAIGGLSLVRTLVTATSGRGGLLTSARAGAETRGGAESERFSRLGATLALADGVMRTSDFTMTSTDVELTGAGSVAVADMMTELAGRARLSEALSKEAGTDLYRYAQEGGRVTLPVTVAGPLDDLSVRVDVGDAASRAIRNRAEEEARRAIERNLPERLRVPIPRRPPGR